MKIAVTSVMGDPRNPATWSNAPAHLIYELEALGVTVVALDSSPLTKAQKVYFALRTYLRGYPVREAARFSDLRSFRGQRVAKCARESGVDHILCTSTMDAPSESNLPYSLWIDNTWDLYCSSASAPRWSGSAIKQVERLERTALTRAEQVLTFSEHVKRNVIEHYGVSPANVHVVGCGSGPLPAFTGEKEFTTGHMLFVAKHLFVKKGGELALEAFKLVQEKRPETRFVIVGDDALVQRVTGIDGVTAYGYLSREKLNQLFYDAAILVQPMASDPWGQVYLEAMKARAVVVSLNVAAVPEITDEARLGVLAEEVSPEAIAEAILSIYARRQEDLDAMTRSAQARVLDLYEWPIVARRIYDALSSSVEDR
ncbi:glycosyltransferase family 4 protein [Coraliomargarita sp. SDUM461004]|uniref:Glycosyltransferase family 4 protein n=1 Tax=Thalassobacterium sedimentorum TaxID=3041258 RepID=A0ABU1ALB9_9BACT|nr:glycosyltransferase family 4 protein [Coraliomargarita sp. SDUM461004]MDQ8195586.1 glycosyltransferase family 4 protein [Coraliomargarita sp. SDUM461004]